MDKFSDNFSDKGYEELLNEYAGESVNSRIRENNEKRKSQESKPAQKSARSVSSGRYFDVSEKKDTPKQTKKYVMKTDSSLKENVSVSETKAKTQPHKPANYDLDIKEIQSFEDEQRAARIAARNNAQSKKVPAPQNAAPKQKALKKQTKSGKKTVSSDTMKFNKTQLHAQGIQRRPQAPVIEKKGIPLNAKSKKNAMRKPSHAKIKINLKALAVVSICIIVSILLSLTALTCINDVLAIGRDDSDVIEVVLPNDADTKTAVKILDESGLIKSRTFCYIFLKAMGYSDKNYLPGVYYLTQSMGVEKMITKFKSSSNRGQLISITIPEGYTIDQIAQKLEKNNICSADSFYKTIDDIDFSSEYSFLSSLDKKEDRYHALEGYMFPATYEFEESADPASIVRSFLSAFASHWTQEYADRAKELDMTVDEVVKMASIIEKEGADSEQFSQISSVLHNRISRSGLYPTLECNSTRDYVTNTISARVTSSSELNKYILGYNTYECEGLPIGAICNPGDAAINAALNPESSSYYFFAHDNKKKIYLAETIDEQSANLRLINSVNSENN